MIFPLSRNKIWSQNRVDARRCEINSAVFPVSISLYFSYISFSALYKGCALLLLDEPTAALDAIAENEMYEKYNEMLTGKTALFISHRLASTRFCDHILFLESGKIKEEGTHEELMQKNGGYAEMFLVQSRYYKEEGAQSHEEDMAGI